MKQILTKWPLALSLLLLWLAACSQPAPVEPEEATAVAVTETTTLSAADTAVPASTEAPTEPAESPPEAAETAPEPPTGLAAAYAEYELVTLLPQDGIPAIDEPQFLSVAEADQFYHPSEFIIGVSLDGDHRAYSIPLLSSHEIVNDTVGGRQIAVTW